MSRTSIGSIIAALSIVAAPAFPAAAADGVIDAVLKSDHPALRDLLANRADPNTRRPDGSTPLHWAVDRQDRESVSMLLAAKADPNAADQDGATPLALACELGDGDIVGQLLGAGAKATAPRPDGVHPIELCAANSTPDALTRLLAAGADVNATSPKGQTPLMWAAARGRTDNVALLAQRGGDLNRASKKGFTPLFFAIQSGVAGLPEAIMQAGGDAGYVSPEGFTALQLALLKDNFELATLLVGKGADINQWDVNGRQPLHIAAMKNNEAFAKLLLAKGADPNVLTKQQYRPEATDAGGVAALKDNVWPANDPSVKVVIRQSLGGVAVPPPPPAKTPLMVAAESGSLGVMKLLVQAGAKPDFRAKDGSNLIMAAVSSSDPDVMRYALELNPDIAAVDNAGDTIMHLAVQRARGEKGEEMIRLLADKGAKLDAPNARGATPADVALRRSEANIRAYYTTLLKERSTVASGPAVRR